ncbi:MAG: hypothetical protein JNM14_03280 [Ferruginibacter sp.]|nr:hypothetical protein [Ferruginibacter sp.]
MKKYLFLFFLFFCFNANAQYFIQYPEWYPATAFKTLFVITRDSSKPHAKEVYNTVKENWTLSPVKLIQARYSHEIPESLFIPGNLFLSAQTNSTSTVFERRYSNGITTRSSPVVNDYFHINLWSAGDKINPKRSISENAFTLASAELFNRTITLGKLAWESEGDFTSSLFANDFCNGMKGNIKNMIQFFNSELPKNNSKKFLTDMPPAAELGNLKKDTLFLPNCWYGGPGTMLVDEKPKYATAMTKFLEDMTADYAYKIKLITREELNQKILNATKNFYYLNYIQSSADKSVSVINGFTGNVVYSEITRKSYLFKEKDLKKIEEAIR